MQLFTNLLAANVEARELTYVILPFEEAGHTNVGTVTASAGTVTVPDPSQITLNIEHDFTRPVGRATRVIEEAKRLVATFRIADTSAGDDLLIEASEGLRTGASVEIDDPVIRQGRLLSGLLTAVAAVVRPAFPSAQLQAADCGEFPTPGGTMPPTQPAAGSLQAGAAEDLAEAVVAVVNEASDEEPTVDEQPVPAQASRAVSPTRAMQAAQAGTQRPTGRAQLTANAAIRHLAATMSNLSLSKSQMLAALEQITQAEAYDEMLQPQWVGELYDGRNFQRRFSPLINHRDLTGMKIQGFKFTSKPEVEDYAGFPAEPPSSPIVAELVEDVVSRVAGAWEFDRIYRDFNVPGFWEALLRFSMDDYDRRVDNKVPAALIAAAGTVPGTADIVGAPPTGVDLAAHLIVEAAMQDVEHSIPTAALVDITSYKGFMKTRAQDNLQYIQTKLGIEGGESLGIQIVPCAALGAGEVLTLAKPAATLYELPGTPVRVDAEAIVRGAVQEAVFGYWGIMIEDASSLAYVTNA